MPEDRIIDCWRNFVDLSACIANDSRPAERCLSGQRSDSSTLKFILTVEQSWSRLLRSWDVHLLRNVSLFDLPVREFVFNSRAVSQFLF